MARKVQKIVVLEYKGEKVKVVLPTENLIERPNMYVGGVIKGAWYKKLKRQFGHHNTKLLDLNLLFQMNFLFLDTENYLFYSRKRH